MYPVLFEFGFITVFSLWLFVAIGFITGSLFFINLAKRNRVRLRLISDHSFFLFFSALIASRFLFIVTNLDLYFYRFSFQNFLSLFAIWDKGLSFWGGVFGLFLAILYLAKKRDESILRLLDILVPSILIGIIFGNIGAFLDGINYGTPTNLPWGMIFRSANVKYISPIHPTQLYSALYSFLIAGGLFMLLKNLRGQLPGFTAEIGLGATSFFIFLEEFVRGDDAIKIMGMRISQLLALLGIFTAAYLIHKRYFNKTGGDPERLLKKFLKPADAKTLETRKFLQNQTG